jgi:hypothetical protein
MSAVAKVEWPFKAHMSGFPAWFTLALGLQPGLVMAQNQQIAQPMRGDREV